MAKNRSMEIKHAKARKCAMQEVLDKNKLEMCANILPRSKSVTWSMAHKPYSICKNV